MSVTDDALPKDGQVCSTCGESGHSECWRADLPPCKWCDEPGQLGHQCDDAPGPGCPNCDGRKCMECCSRAYHDECVDDCPDCCAPAPCTTCDGMGAVEFPEFLPCPACQPAQHLAERVLCDLPIRDKGSILAACKITGIDLFEPAEEPDAVGLLIQNWVADAERKEASYRDRPPGLTDFGHLALGLQSTMLRGCAEDLRAALGRPPRGEWPLESPW